MILLSIDIQKGITDSRLYNYDSFVDNCQRLLAAARKSGVEVIHIQHDDGPGSGFSVGDADFEISELVAPVPGERVFIKSINSCFGNKDFSRYLVDKGVTELMIIGLQTNFCIDATVKSAFEKGYKVIVPYGANSTFDNDYMSGETTYRYYNDMMWPERFAECITMDKALEYIEYGKRE